MPNFPVNKQMNNFKHIFFQHHPILKKGEKIFSQGLVCGGYGKIMQ